MKAVKHSAPGPYLGFALQPVRLCYHLLTNNGAALVSLEHLDDVAVQYSDGKTLLEQTKSALGRHNPLSDWSVDLWKTISNWLDTIKSGAVQAERTRFVLYVTPVKTGTWAQQLSEVKASTDIDTIVSAIDSKLRAMATPPESAPYVQHFLAAPQKEREALVRNFEVLSVDADPVEPLRALMRPTVAPDVIDLICKSAIGLAKEQADELIRKRKPAIIDSAQFCTEFRTFVQKHNLPALLNSLTEPPKAVEVQTLFINRPTFIRQLEIIDIPRDERLRAVSDYLRTSADKSTWADAGYIFARDLRDWDDDLMRHHGYIRGEVSDAYADREEPIRGRLVYRRCCSITTAFGGRAVPGHFIPGSFHALSDTLAIGWHPSYSKLLDETK